MKTKFTAYGMTVKVHEVRYHRNGISGAGFFGVLFDWEEQGDHGERFFATLDAEDLAMDDHGELIGGLAKNRDITCRVIWLDDITLRWRGDNFAPALADAIVYASRKELLQH